jgi:hypothetical protein
MKKVNHYVVNILEIFLFEEIRESGKTVPIKLLFWNEPVNILALVFQTHLILILKGK